MNTRALMLSALLLVSFLCFLPPTKTVSAVAAPPLEWSKTYGGTGSEFAHSAVQAGDGGYAIVGETGSYGAGGLDFWLVKTDLDGKMQWSKTYGGTDHESAHAIVQTSDLGYVLAGWTRSYGVGGYDLWFVKTDATGSGLWNKTYGGALYDDAKSMVQTSDGGFAIAGSTYSFAVGGGSDGWLLRTDSSGKLLWNMSYGGTDYDDLLSVVQADGGYTMIGITRSYGAGDQDIWVVRTDSEGNMLWNRTYGGAGTEWGWSIVQAGDGGYMLAGTTDSFGAGGRDLWLIKTDSEGNAQWNVTYGGGDDDRGCSLIRTDNRDFVVAGYTGSYGAGGTDYWLIKVDSWGKMLWSKTYGGTNEDYVKCVLSTNDGGYAMAGTTYSYGAGSSDFWLVKVASEECSASWPMFHHDARHTGYSTSEAPDTNSTIWMHATDNVFIWWWKGSPAVAGGRLFVGGGSRVYALNATTGVELWFFETAWGVESTPAVDSGIVYVGSMDSKVYALNASSGALIWSYTTGYRIQSSPTVAYGKVYIGSGDSNVYALDAATGAYVWSYTTEDMVFSTPAVCEGRVYVQDSLNTYALNASTGEHIWTYYLGGFLSPSSPSVADGRVYTTSGGYAYALNATTGSEIWSFYGANGWSSPIAIDGMLYVGSDDGVCALNATTGELAWNSAIGWTGSSSPALADSKIFVGCDDGRICALDADNGAVVWTYSTGNVMSSSPAVAYGRVYAVPDNGNVYAFAPTPWAVWTQYHSYSEILETLDYLNAFYPQVVDVFSIGKSWLNQDIYCIRLTNESNSHPKPKILFIGYHHAREFISAELPLYFAVEAAEGFGTNATLTRMLNYSEIYIIPMLNVDAFIVAKQNEWQRKNVHPSDDDGDALLDEDPPSDTDSDGYIRSLVLGTPWWNGNTISYEGNDIDADGLLDWVGGVDINRNYGYQWDAACVSGSPYPWAEDYRGPSPFSEPETQAIGNLALDYDFKYAVSLHSGTESIGYPWGYTADPAPDDAVFREVAANLSLLVGAPYGQNSYMYNMSGSWDDWMYANRSVLALTCEIYGNWSAWQVEPGPDPDTWWVKGIFQVFNPDPMKIESVVQRWLPVFTYTTDRAITEAYDLAICNVTLLKTIVGQGYTMRINVTATNAGYFSETSEVVLYANATTVGAQSVTLTSGSSKTMTFTWDTTGYAKGNYIISASARPIAGETDISDNTLAEGWVFVSITGDVNADRKVDLKDVFAVGKGFGSIRGPDGLYWHSPAKVCCPHSPNCDINDDGKIDLKDYFAACKSFGQSW